MRDFVLLIGISTMLAISLVTYITFFVAYLSPTKSANVHINSYGEADVEMIMLSALLPLNLLTAVLLSKRVTERPKEEMIIKYLEGADRRYR